MRDRIVTWTLRLGGWALLLIVAVRIVSQPTRAGLEGRLWQMHDRGSNRRAGAAFLRESGLDRYFNPAQHRLFSMYGFRGSGLPTFVGLIEYQHTIDGNPRTRFIRTELDGQVLLPPLDIPTRMPLFDAASIPECVNLQDRDGHPLPAAVMGLFSKTGKSEWMIWVHRVNRWMNVLRVECIAPNLGELEPVPSPERANAVEIRGCNARFLWDALNERFIVAPDLDARVQVLPPLSDQMLQP